MYWEIFWFSDQQRSFIKVGKQFTYFLDLEAWFQVWSLNNCPHLESIWNPNFHQFHHWLPFWYWGLVNLVSKYENSNRYYPSFGFEQLFIKCLTKFCCYSLTKWVADWSILSTVNVADPSKMCFSKSNRSCRKISTVLTWSEVKSMY